MRAKLVKQPEPAVSVTKQDVGFAREPCPNRRTVHLRYLPGNRDGCPITPKHFPHGCPRPNAANQFIVFSAHG